MTNDRLLAGRLPFRYNRDTQDLRAALFAAGGQQPDNITGLAQCKFNKLRPVRAAANAAEPSSQPWPGGAGSAKSNSERILIR